MDRQGRTQAPDLAGGPAARVRFLRHLAAALAVAVVVVMGLAWNHFAASSLAGGPHGPGQKVIPGAHAGVRPPGGLVVVHGVVVRGPHGAKVIRGGPMKLGLNSMLDPVNLPYLRHTVVIEGAVIAAVVIIDASRRRWRRARRAARRG